MSRKFNSHLKNVQHIPLLKQIRMQCGHKFKIFKIFFFFMLDFLGPLSVIGVVHCKCLTYINGQKQLPSSAQKTGVAYVCPFWKKACGLNRAFGKNVTKILKSAFNKTDFKFRCLFQWISLQKHKKCGFKSVYFLKSDDACVWFLKRGNKCGL